MFLRLVGVYSELKICANTKLFKESERERERRGWRNSSGQQVVNRKEGSATEEAWVKRITKKPRSTSSKASGSSTKVGLESGTGVCQLGAIFVGRFWRTVNVNCEALC